MPLQVRLTGGKLQNSLRLSDQERIPDTSLVYFVSQTNEMTKKKNKKKKN